MGCPGLSHGNLGQLGPRTGRVVLGTGMSRDVPGCPMATWDNSDLGLAGWCKVGGGSQDVPGCPMATWDNSDLGLAGWCKV